MCGIFLYNHLRFHIYYIKKEQQNNIKKRQKKSRLISESGLYIY